MNNDTFIVPEEIRILTVAEEERVIRVPSEWREIKVMGTMLIASKRHTEGDIKRWTVDYSRWLENPAKIASATVTSSSTSCTVTPPATVLGKEVIFFLNGGAVGETLTVSLEVIDSDSNKKHDTIAFTVVAP